MVQGLQAHHGSTHSVIGMGEMHSCTVMYAACSLGKITTTTEALQPGYYSMG